VLDITIATCSERGRRPTNQDNVRVTRDGERWIAVLADGAGGHRGGAEAARRAVDQLDAALQDTHGEFGARVLTSAVVSAHACVQRAQRESDSVGDMHSTVVALWIDTDHDAALWSHVGDSRLYRVRNGRLELLTADDSVVQRLVDAGLLTPQQAKAHPQKNQLIAALGIEDDLEPHTLAEPAALAEGDAFLLCSDGWWGALTEQFVTATLAVAATPAQWLSLMQQRIEVLDLPRQDNYSAIGVWVADPSEATRPMVLSG
jgi:serine/threonine protein phosphatase PrpC